MCVCEAAEVTKYENDCASGSAVVACHMCAMYIELPQDGAAREANRGGRQDGLQGEETAAVGRAFHVCARSFWEPHCLAPVVNGNCGTKDDNALPTRLPTAPAPPPLDCLPCCCRD